MKQVIQNYNTGELILAEVPAPSLGNNSLLIRTETSLVSVGTERYMLDLAKKSLIGKALARPDLVKQVINKVQTEGLGEAWRQSKGRLDTPVPLGYSAAGVVTAVGNSVTGFAVGDRVACAGSGIASHAEILRVPQTLAVKIPDNVGFEAASFVALGGIAMHAIRMAELTFGERVVVLGLGLLGQLAVQILNSAGYWVFGADVVPSKVKMALEHGAHDGATIGQDDVVSAVRTLTGAHGADAVIIFASSKSNDPIELAAGLARERGRIVVPGLVGLDIPRKVFYEKELDFLVSRAWGPGMYDPAYEAGKVDYPLSFVRWTAQRNMAHFLEMLSDGKVMVEHLITYRFPIDRAVEAYEMILNGKEPVIGVILTYPGKPDFSRRVDLGRGDNGSPQRTPRTQRLPEKTPQSSARSASSAVNKDSVVSIGLIGAGLFAKGTLLPALKGIEGAKPWAVATSTGLSGEHIAKKYSLAYYTTDVKEILEDPEIDLVMILTRHGSHASLVCEALRSGKHVYVEKPLCLNEKQLDEIVNLYSSLFTSHSSRPYLVVGFNRRFAPTTQFLLKHLQGIATPKIVTVRANVGYIPPEVWVHDPEQGGGNIIGEACHFVDLIQTLTQSHPISVYASAVRSESEAVIPDDNMVITLTMADGSVGNIVYTALGDKAYQRERVELFAGGGVGVIENFKTALWSQGGQRKKMGNILTGVDRGYQAEMQALIGSLREDRPFPVSFDSYVATTKATFAAMESLRTGQPVNIHGGGC